MSFEPFKDLAELTAKHSPSEIWAMVAERFPQEAAALSKHEFFVFTYLKMQSLPCDIESIRKNPLPDVARERVQRDYVAFGGGTVVEYFARCLLQGCVYA